MKIFKKINIFFSFTLSVILTLNSCIFDPGGFTDDNENVLTYPVTFTIKTRSASDIYASDEEMMHIIDLYIVNNLDSKIEKIIHLQFTALTEEHKESLKLTTGRKIVYGFANLSSAQKTDIGLDGLAESNVMPDLSSADCTLSNGFSIITTSGSEQYLPMSNSSTFNVTNTSGQAFNLELVRLLCKIKLTFRNESGYKLAIKDFSLSPFTSSAIYALPRNTQGKPVFPGVLSQAIYNQTLSPEPSLENNESVEYNAYLNETSVSDDGFLKLNVTTVKDGSIINVYRMSLTNLNYLNRNDYLPLTVILSDYKLALEVRSYPPIGGYATSVSTGTDEYYINFTGGGPFVIIPKLTKISDGSVVTLANSDITFTYTDATTTIFDTPPTLSNAEITGVLKTTGTGKALCNVSLNILTGSGITRILTYKVYISLN